MFSHVFLYAYKFLYHSGTNIPCSINSSVEIVFMITLLHTIYQLLLRLNARAVYPFLHNFNTIISSSQVSSSSILGIHVIKALSAHSHSPMTVEILCHFLLLIFGTWTHVKLEQTKCPPFSSTSSRKSPFARSSYVCLLNVNGGAEFTQRTKLWELATRGYRVQMDRVHGVQIITASEHCQHSSNIVTLLRQHTVKRPDITIGAGISITPSGHETGARTWYLMPMISHIPASIFLHRTEQYFQPCIISLIAILQISDCQYAFLNFLESYEEFWIGGLLSTWESHGTTTCSPINVRAS